MHIFTTIYNNISLVTYRIGVHKTIKWKSSCTFVTIFVLPSFNTFTVVGSLCIYTAAIVITRGWNTFVNIWNKKIFLSKFTKYNIRRLIQDNTFKVTNLSHSFAPAIPQYIDKSRSHYYWSKSRYWGMGWLLSTLGHLKQHIQHLLQPPLEGTKLIEKIA